VEMVEHLTFDITRHTCNARTTKSFLSFICCEWMSSGYSLHMHLQMYY